MGQTELLIAGLLVAVAGLSALACRPSVPYPIVLVVGGALIGFVPGLPEVKLDPEVMLVVFLPPLLYGESIFANFGDFRANLRAHPQHGWAGARIGSTTGERCKSQASATSSAAPSVEIGFHGL